MYTETDIIAKAWLATEIVNLVLFNDRLSVEKVFLIGSYANGNPNSRSDIDFLIQLKGGTRPGQYYPTWKQIEEIHAKLDTRRVHVIFGREETQKSLFEKHNKKYKEIFQGRIQRANSHSSSVS